LTKNIIESVKARLLNIAGMSGVSFDFIILRYMQERLIFRLVNSEFRDKFILKGGLYFILFDKINSRVTKDIDLLGVYVKNSEKDMQSIFSLISASEFDDGLYFEHNNIKSEVINEQADYEGIRIYIGCSLGKIKKNLQIDIGFGDIVYPGYLNANYPSLLYDDILNLQVYSLESIIAEKFEAMVKLLYINSRMKDFYDIYNISDNHTISGEHLKNAIRLTFENRKTNLDSVPVLFTEEFYFDEGINNQWKLFVKRIKITGIEFQAVIKRIEKLTTPLLQGIIEEKKFDKTWDHNSRDWINIG